MARDVDRVIDFIRAQDFIPPVHRQVMVDRIEGAGEPSQAELDRAAAKVYPDEARPVVEPPAGLFGFEVPPYLTSSGRAELASVGGRVIIGTVEQMRSGLALSGWTVVPVADDIERETLTVDEWMARSGLTWHREMKTWVGTETMRYGISKLAAEHRG